MKTNHPSVRELAIFPCAVCGARLDRLHLEPGRNGSVCGFCGAEQPFPDGPGDDRGSERPADPHLGDTLRIAREDRGEDLDGAARVMGIRASYLRDLESGDRSFEPYPGRAYGRFFLRQYAEYLDLEPAPLIRAYDREAEPTLDLPPRSPTISRRPPRPRRWAAAAFVLLAGLLVATALLDPSSSAPTALPSTGPSASRPAATPTPNQHASHPGPPAGIHAVVTLTARCWIKAIVDGRNVVERTFLPGKVLRLHGERTLRLTLGNAGGARLEVDGRVIATGGTGEVQRLSFAWRDGHLVTQ